MVIGGGGVHYPILTMNIFVPTPVPDFFYLPQRNKNALPVAPAMMTIKQRNKLYSMTKRVIKEVFTDFNTRESYGEQLIDARYDVTSTNGGDFWKRIKYVYDEYYVGLVPGFNLLEYHIRQCGIDADTDNNDDFNAEFWLIEPLRDFGVDTDVALFLEVLIDMFFWFSATHRTSQKTKYVRSVRAIQALWRGHSARWKYPMFTWDK
jgi:hypothetical protein